jgi:uncharacterized protein (TIGR00251 family)
MNENQAILNIRVQTGSSKNTITGYSDSVLHIKITTRPEKGKANESLLKYLSHLLGIPKSRIEIQKGTTSRNKVLLIDGLSTEEISLMLFSHLNGKKH